MEVLNSPLELTETWFVFLFLSALPNQPFLGSGGWRLGQGLAGLLCQNLSALLFLCWKECKGFQVEIWLGFLLRELAGRMPGRSVPLGRTACPVNPLGVRGTDPGAPNSTWLRFRSQSSTLGKLRCLNGALGVSSKSWGNHQEKVLPLQRPHLEQKQVLFPEGCSTSSSHGALSAQAVEDQEMLAEQLSCSSSIPVEWWGEAVGTARENPPPSPGHGLCLGIRLLLRWFELGVWWFFHGLGHSLV